MIYSIAIILVGVSIKCCIANESLCENKCQTRSDDVLSCAFDVTNRTYRTFPNSCFMKFFKECYDADIIETPLEYCIKDKLKSRRMYGESCPVFCPSHYRPVCGANTIRSYVYRAFNNGCYLDMINCRGDEDFAAYTEVPLEFCQKHQMKNIFREVVVMSGIKDYHEYL